MATKKKSKSKSWIDDQVDELNDAFKDKIIPEKRTKSVWPKITIGSHSTRTEYEDGRVEFVTDWEALQRDVKEAIASYEAENGKVKIKSPVAAMTATKKVKNKK
jgi:hypothetical protein